MSRIVDLVTVNVWGLPWPLSRHRHRRFERIRRHFAKQRYDVAGLQEAWWPHRDRLGLPGLRFPQGGRDSGLGLAGSAEVADLRLVSFRSVAGTDRLKRKGVLLGRTGELTVAVTHLQASPWHAPVRARQVAQLLEVLQDVRGPLALLGDFNFYGGDAANAERLLEAGFVDVGGGSTYLRRNPYTWSHGHRFDRIYLRGGPEAVEVRVLPRIFSDHQPLHATIRLG